LVIALAANRTMSDLSLRIFPDARPRSPQKTRLRALPEKTGSGPCPAAGHTGHILAALRASPLVGVELDLHRPRDGGRNIDG